MGRGSRRLRDANGSATTLFRLGLNWRRLISIENPIFLSLEGVSRQRPLEASLPLVSAAPIYWRASEPKLRGRPQERLDLAYTAR
jgi:hypothetical protein